MTGFASIVSTLIEKDAVTDCTDKHHRTPLYADLTICNTYTHTYTHNVHAYTTHTMAALLTLVLVTWQLGRVTHVA